MKLPLSSLPTSPSARQPQQPPPPRRPHRYRKGMMMVGLLLISESYTVVNAISFWNQFKLPRPPQPQQPQQQGGSKSSSSTATATSKSHTECRSSSSRHSHPEECLPPPPTTSTVPGVPWHEGPPTFLYAWWQLFAFPRSQSSTTTATTTPTLQKMAAWPRGGALVVVPDTTPSLSYQQRMPLYFWKLVFQSVLTLINVICWYVPLQLHARQQRKAQPGAQVEVTSTTTATPTTSTTTTSATTTEPSLQHQNSNNDNDITEANQFYMSIANAFSGGVFLSLAFGHLIPECVHGFAHYSMIQTNTNGNDPTTTTTGTQPYWFVLTGYLLIFVVEKVAFSESHELLSHHHHHPTPASHSNHHTATATATDDDDDNNTNTNHKSPPPTLNMNGGSAVSSSVLSPPPTTTTSSSTSPPPSSLATGRSALILLAALGVHSVLEMMALGLADTFRDCALLTISISLHQPAESIALLVAFIKSGLTHTQIIVFLSIFSSMGMIGVLLGMMVNEYAAPIVDSIMLAIVAGTFVYVGATEIIPEEFESSQYKWKKFLAFLSGIVTILCITQYTATLGGH